MVELHLTELFKIASFSKKGLIYLHTCFPLNDTLLHFSILCNFWFVCSGRYPTATKYRTIFMNTSSKYTYIEYRIQSDAKRYTLAAYNIFVFLSSLLGDSLILLASSRRNTFRVKKMLVVVIQHIAVSDLASSFSFVLPQAISLLSNSWILGGVLCTISPYIAYTVFPTGMFLIVVLTTCKILLLKFPLRAASCPPRRAHQICGFFWCVLLVYPITFFVVDKSDVHFDYRVYNCEYGYSAIVWEGVLKLPMALLGFITYIIPNVLIVIATIPTLKYLIVARKSAKRVQGSVPWQGALTVSLTAIVFCVSTFPYSVYATAFPYLKEDSWCDFNVHFHRVSYSLTLLNVMSNFYIYFFTMRSFRGFLLSRSTQSSPKTGNSETN